MIFLTDFGSEESIRFRSPSAVPLVCIIRLIDRSNALSAEYRGNGRMPGNRRDVSSDEAIDEWITAEN